jgi:predicted Abi (CAAX) family protease
MPSVMGCRIQMKISILPRSAPGKWSTWLAGGFFLFFALLRGLVVSGQHGGETFFSNMALAVPGLLAGACGIAAFFTGAVGIIFRHEHAVLTFLATLIGLCVLLFCLGEILSPH